MKTNAPEDSALNPPAVVFARLLFVARLGSFLAGPTFGIAALASHDGWSAVKSVLCFAAMVSSHLVLRWTGRLRECSESFERLLVVPPEVDASTASRFEALLAQSEALERQRGTQGFDPWEALRLRREIETCARANPNLRELLEQYRRQHELSDQ